VNSLHVAISDPDLETRGGGGVILTSRRENEKVKSRRTRGAKRRRRDVFKIDVSFVIRT